MEQYAVIEIEKGTCANGQRDWCYGISGPVRIGTGWHKNNREDCERYCAHLNAIALAGANSMQGRINALEAALKKAHEYVFQNQMDIETSWGAEYKDAARQAEKYPLVQEISQILNK